jgi:phosphoesterase RecJ-like protein
MAVIKKIIDTIKSVKTVVICHHVAPDGDCLGTALALQEMLSQMGHLERIDAVITGYVPDIYKFLPNIENLKKPNDPSLLKNYDLAITVDCACKDRLGDATELFNKAKKTINIDHHISNEGFADIDYIKHNVSSTGEVLFSLVNRMESKITKSIATNLYTAILTDTGGFKFENTKPETLKICAKLIESGADPVYIYKQCYELKPVEMVQLHAKAVSNAIYVDNSKIVYSKITRKLLEELNANDDHIDGITETLRQVNTVEVALVFKETTRGTTKVSFRSNGINVCEIASFFGGGGHVLAAGCLLEKSIDEAVSDVIATVSNQVSKMKAYA